MDITGFVTDAEILNRVVTDNQSWQDVAMEIGAELSKLPSNVICKNLEEVQRKGFSV